MPRSRTRSPAARPRAPRRTSPPRTRSATSLPRRVSRRWTATRSAGSGSSQFPSRLLEGLGVGKERHGISPTDRPTPDPSRKREGRLTLALLPEAVRPALAGRLPGWDEPRWWDSPEALVELAPAAEIGWFDMHEKPP